MFSRHTKEPHAIGLVGRFLIFAAPYVLGAFTHSAWAQVHTGDIILRVDTGAIQTGGISGSPGVFTPQRVFVTDFGLIADNFTDSPGFDCNPGTFPAGSRIGFRVRDALRKWNGTDFSMIPLEVLRIERLSLLTLTPTSPQVVEGFQLTVGGNGQWHRHLEYTLDAPSANGVYLLQLTLYSTMPAISESEPFWMIFGQNATPGDNAAAAQWARDNLLNADGACDSIDFNRDGVSPDSADIADFLSVFSGGPCSSDPPTGTGCGDIDFNNDAVSPDSTDIDALLRVFAGGAC